MVYVIATTAPYPFLTSIIIFCCLLSLSAVRLCYLSLLFISAVSIHLCSLPSRNMTLLRCIITITYNQRAHEAIARFGTCRT